MKTKVSIIIANYNGEEFLPECLNSVIKFKPFNSEIVVVDDYSTDNSLNIITEFQKRDNSIRIIKNKINLGAAESRNIAIKKATGDILVFLDNDTEVLKDSFTNLLATFDDKAVGAAQSLLVDYEDRNLVQNGGGLLIPQVGWLAPYYQKQNVENVTNKKLNIIAISACLAVRKSVIKKIEGFDKDLAVYTEDLDFSWRIWIAGWKIVLCPNSIVYHWTKSVSKRKTMKATYEQIYFHLAKNSLTSTFKNYEMINVLKFFPVSIAINLGRALYILVKRKNTYALVGTIKAIVWFGKNYMHILNKRKQISLTRKTSDHVLFSKIISSDSLITNYKKYFI